MNNSYNWLHAHIDKAIKKQKLIDVLDNENTREDEVRNLVLRKLTM